MFGKEPKYEYQWKCRSCMSHYIWSTKTHVGLGGTLDEWQVEKRTPVTALGEGNTDQFVYTTLHDFERTNLRRERKNVSSV